MKLWKNDLARMMAQEHNISIPAANEQIDRVVEVIVTALANHDEVTLSSFGTFGSKLRRGRYFPDPRTQEKVYVDDKWMPYFKFSKHTVDLINENKGDGNGKET